MPPAPLHRLSLLAALALVGCSDGPAPPAPNLAPRALFSVSACALAGDEVALDASASGDDDGFVREFRFLFGDGSSERRQTSPVARHVFDGPGVYALVVTAIDDRGAAATARRELAVLARVLCGSDAQCGAGLRCQDGVCRDDGDGGACSTRAPCAGGPASCDGGANPTDGGANPTDGGANSTDGGANPTDGGANPTDGGASPTDGGANPTDGG